MGIVFSKLYVCLNEKSTVIKMQTVVHLRKTNKQQINNSTLSYNVLHF